MVKKISNLKLYLLNRKINISESNIDKNILHYHSIHHIIPLPHYLHHYFIIIYIITLILQFIIKFNEIFFHFTFILKDC